MKQMLESIKSLVCITESLEDIDLIDGGYWAYKYNNKDRIIQGDLSEGYDSELLHLYNELYDINLTDTMTTAKVFSLLHELGHYKYLSKRGKIHSFISDIIYKHRVSNIDKQSKKLYRARNELKKLKRMVLDTQHKIIISEDISIYDKVELLDQATKELEAIDKDIDTANDKIRQLDIAYRNIPEERSADLFAINYIKEHFECLLA